MQRIRWPLWSATFLTLFCLSSSGIADVVHASGRGTLDPVVLTFSTIGDSRQDPVHFDPTQVDPKTGALRREDAHWLQNGRALTRILREISADHPQLLFFNGDMIMGYGRAGVPPGWSEAPPTVAQIEASDLVADIAQYAYWRGMIASVVEAGTYVVPVAGNHEIECNNAHQTDRFNQLPCDPGKRARVENEVAWAHNMGDLIVDEDRFESLFGERPTHVTHDIAPMDGEGTDQGQLTYSFDFRGVHFALINTDPVGEGPEGKGLDSHAPTRWLEADLAAARARGLKHVFVFGHKPAYTYDTSGKGTVRDRGLDVDPAARDRFWSVIEAYGATYFCGHQHTYHVNRPQGRAYQVLVGSGGSPFDVAPGESSAHPDTDRHYVWATVRIHRSGKVDLETTGFDDRFGKTRLISRTLLTH